MEFDLPPFLELGNMYLLEGGNQTFINLFSYFTYIAYVIVCDTICSVSSLASFMSNQETSFVTLGQRVLAKPLK